MAKDNDKAVRGNPALYAADEGGYERKASGTPDSRSSTQNRGRRATDVNGAVAGSGAGAGGGGGPEDYDSDPQGGGAAMPKPVAKPTPERGGDSRIHGSH
ncbi:hypothetical protein [Sphingomonas quercus]|uniref:Uncharacterized protein n=1 Tax=Sphingomonas quercus TaxID=2842451 RepID=A0ABS6BI29_9SPHN|nr:hypothetical protein [Sphingomonas quercus]MBU3076899.1 hypothetical protein [Sphingomonas quercus]